jgi:hypothetical protein
MICVEPFKGYIYNEAQQKVPITVFRPVEHQPQDTAGCAYVMANGQEISPSPFNMTVEQASQIGVSIFLLWAAAWCIRTIVRMLNQSTQEE